MSSKMFTAEEVATWLSRFEQSVETGRLSRLSIRGRLLATRVTLNERWKLQRPIVNQLRREV